MTLDHPTETEAHQISPNLEIQKTAEVETSLDTSDEPKMEKILCPHCRRTATNGVKCQGICVADSDY